MPIKFYGKVKSNLRCGLLLLTDALRQHLCIFFILGSTSAFSQLHKDRWTVVPGVSIGKYVNEISFDRRVETVSKQRVVLGSLGIGYYLNAKLMVGAGFQINSYKVSANDTIHKTFPLKFSYRFYRGRRIVPAIWAIYSFPITNRINFLLEISASVGRRRGKLEVVSVRDSVPTPVVSTVKFYEKESFGEFSISPSLGYRVNKLGLIALNISEIGFRRDLILTPEAGRKYGTRSSLSIAPLKIGLTLIMPIKGNPYSE